MKPTTTRTLNPLPFQDLEPHRFEDLVRQLAYDFRHWKRLEPTGKGGADDGMDIRAIELVALEEPEEADEDTAEELGPVPFAERLWIFQCKREKEIGPKALRKIVTESLPAGQPTPHGFVLAAACDLSKQAHDAFREEMVARKIGEFYLWGRSTLEDMLFQPKNDRLLFAYFGISLQPQRRSMRTQLRSVIAIKKQVYTLLEKKKEDHGDKRIVLLRDPNDTSYPEESDKAGARQPSWFLCECTDIRDPDGFAVLRHDYLAWISPDRKKWDAIESHDYAPGLVKGRLDQNSTRRRDEKPDPRGAFLSEFWREYIPHTDLAWLKVAKVVLFERILAIDPHGDRYYPVPHIFVEWDREDGPFAEGAYRWLEPVTRDYRGKPRAVDETRTRYFPNPMPTSLFPPPEGLSHPLAEKGATLEDATQQGITEALAQARARIEAAAKKPDAVGDPKSGARLQTERFRTWRDEVAVPVFSAFVQQLEAEGHHARVAARAVGLDETGSASSSEVIELRMRLRSPTSGNPEYWHEGHITYSIASHMGEKITVEQSPKPEEPSSQRHHAPVRPEPITLDVLTAARVQSDVLALLKRLAERTFP